MDHFRDESSCLNAFEIGKWVPVVISLFCIHLRFILHLALVVQLKYVLWRQSSSNSLVIGKIICIFCILAHDNFSNYNFGNKEGLCDK